MGNSNTIEIRLLVKDDGSVVVKQFESGTTKSMKAIEDSVTRTWDALKPMLASFVTGWGVAKVAAELEQMIDRFSQSQKAAAGLDTALQSMGRYTPQFSQDLKNYAVQLAGVSTYTGDATIEAAKFLAIHEDISDDLMPRSIKAAQNLAAMLGGGPGGLTMAAELLGRASEGMVMGLRRIGIAVDENLYKTQGYAGVLQQIEKMVGGQASAMRDLTPSYQLATTEMGRLVTITGGYLSLSLGKAFSEEAEMLRKFNDEARARLEIQIKWATLQRASAMGQRMPAEAEGAGGLGGEMAQVPGMPSPEAITAAYDRLRQEMTRESQRLQTLSGFNAPGSMAETLESMLQGEFIERSLWEDKIRMMYEARWAELEAEAKKHESEMSNYAIEAGQKIFFEKQKQLQELRDMQETYDRTQRVAKEKETAAYESALAAEMGYTEDYRKVMIETEVAVQKASLKTFYTIRDGCQEVLAGGITDAFDTIIWKSHDLASEFTKLAESIIRDIQRIIVQTAISGPAANWLMSLWPTPELPVTTPIWVHEGGEVGPDTPKHHPMPAALFYGAPRFHTGFAPDEYPAILQQGETVIPRGAGGVNVTVINKSGGQVDVQQSRNAQGGRDVTVVIGEAMAGDIYSQGPLHRAIRQVFGAAPATGGR